MPRQPALARGSSASAAARRRRGRRRMLELQAALRRRGAAPARSARRRRASPTRAAPAAAAASTATVAGTAVSPAEGPAAAGGGAAIRTGAQVRALWDGDWLPATVVRRGLADRSWTVQWAEDGSFTESMPEAELRLLARGQTPPAPSAPALPAAAAAPPPPQELPPRAQPLPQGLVERRVNRRECGGYSVFKLRQQWGFSCAGCGKAKETKRVAHDPSRCLSMCRPCLQRLSADTAAQRAAEARGERPAGGRGMRA
eukprot:TRINITY_DN31425_c0_g1_i1.p2 TRINITY_DN31425_c0_g1~~TRINITY_DN31425_c0_g1_i1.p2  ORF type:complete len:280 (+),score=67.27 TRINITY_DN31425_c0_g1_i1:71-841(+)